MARRPSHALAVGAACLVLAGGMAGSEDAAPGRPLMLAVVINGRDTGLLGSFEQRGGALFATLAELRELGLRAGPGAAGEGAQSLAAALPGLTYHLDERRQVLQISAPPGLLAPTLLDGAAAAGASPKVQSDTGGVFNYTVVSTEAGGRSLVQGQLDVRVFSPVGVLETGVLAQSGGSRLGRAGMLTRLDTTYSYSDPDSLRRYHAGDMITGGLAWTRPVRLGGLQVTTDFSLRSDLVTFPVPTIAGAVAVPSSIDVLLNNVQLLSRDVPPGPFELRQLPVVTGAGSVSLAITNALGQQVTQTLPFYASNALLARGLAAFSGEIGAVRLAYGTLGNDYRSAAGSGTYRRGVADWLTVEAHAEATPSLAMAGGGITLTAWSLGVVSLGGAGSTTRARMGGQVYAAFERVSPSISLTGSLRCATPGFRDVAALYGDSTPRLAARAGLGLSLGGWGSLGVQLTVIRRSAVTAESKALGGGLGESAAYPLAVSPQQTGYALTPASRTTLVSASYSRQVWGNRAFFYATGFTDVSQRHSAGAVMGLSIPLGERASVSASASTGFGQTYATLQASRSAVEVGDVGGQVAASIGQPTRQFADLRYRGEAALLGLGVDRSGGQAAYRASAQGSLALVDGRLFAANTIYDSFAVVDTSGIAGIKVLQENRPAGETDRTGTRLVNDLRAFEPNRLDIDPRDVPLDAALDTATQIVRPQDRSGVVVRFALRPMRAALLSLVDAAGQALPVGSQAELASTGVAALVGFDGQAFVTGLGEHNVLTVKQPNGVGCMVHFAFQPHPGALPKLGPLACLAAAS